MLKSAAFEGISGAGKTTCATLLKKFLAREGIRLLVFNEKEEAGEQLQTGTSRQTG